MVAAGTEVLGFTATTLLASARLRTVYSQRGSYYESCAVVEKV
jgi:hypothetical protein